MIEHTTAEIAECAEKFGFVILNEAKDLLLHWHTRQQVLRFAQDDNPRY